MLVVVDVVYAWIREPAMADGIEGERGEEIVQQNKQKIK